MTISRRRIILAGLLGGGAFALSGCISPPSVTRNIRVTAQAEVAGKIVEGSAVMSLRWKAGDGSRMYNMGQSEAIVLELDGRGTVYILDVSWAPDGRTGGSYWFSMVKEMFDIRGNGKLSDFPKIKALQGRYPVQRVFAEKQVLPIMVYLTDEAKYETLAEVKPDGFSAVFGSDVRFLGMWFEFTEDEVTSIIPDRLPVAINVNASFWGAFPNRNSEGDLLNYRERAFPQNISLRSFYNREF